MQIIHKLINSYCGQGNKTKNIVFAQIGNFIAVCGKNNFMPLLNKSILGINEWCRLR